MMIHRYAAAALAALLILSTVGTAFGAAAVKEDYPALQKQIASKQVVRATLSQRKHTVTVKLANGQKFKAPYPPGDQSTLVASLKASGAKVHVTRKATSSGLRLRYIALIGLAVIAIGGAAFYMLRGRQASQPAAGDAGPPATPEGPPATPESPPAPQGPPAS